MRRVAGMFAVGMLLLGFCLSCGVADDRHKQQREGTKSTRVVSCEDIIRGDVVVHGHLDRPLGTMVTLTGQCVAEPEPRLKENMGKTFFEIKAIDGVAVSLERVIELRDFLGFTPLKLKVGKSYRLRGYETGAFAGVPSKAYKEYIDNGGAHFATRGGPSLSIHFEAVSVNPAPADGKVREVGTTENDR